MSMPPLLSGLLDAVALLIGVTGVVVICYGAFKSIIGFIITEAARLRGPALPGSLNRLRFGFGEYLLLGLEFMVAADIVHTITKPDLQSLTVLGAIVVIRTVISYFLGRELNSQID